MKTLSQSEIYDKNIFLRVDLNVPMTNGKIRDDSKITSVIPTIKHLIKNNNKIIICSHLGRPKGSYNKDLSLQPIALRLSEFLENIEIFTLAERLGGVESLIEHPAIMTHASIDKKIREELGISDTLIRLSVGIEDVNDLKEALDKALNLI